MNPLAGAISLRACLACPTCWGLILGALGLWLVVPRHTRLSQGIGGLLAAAGMACLAYDLPRLADLSQAVLFWLMAGVALAAAVATISSQSPVYSAVWFALSLLGTAGLFLLQGAQFLGAATIVVYAGAIVVTFLFVLMLAQPAGHASYDRLGWGWFARTAAVAVAGAALVGILSHTLAAFGPGDFREQVIALLPADAPPLVAARIGRDAGEGLPVTLVFRPTGPDASPPAVDVAALAPQIAALLTEPKAGAAPPRVLVRAELSAADVLSSQHMAHLGGYLFSRHLVAVELAGTLLLAALVGAVAIVLQGRLAREEPQHV